jgi:hypothetical protein
MPREGGAGSLGNLRYAPSTLTIMRPFWPLIDKAFRSVGRLMRPAKA